MVNLSGWLKIQFSRGAHAPSRALRGARAAKKWKCDNPIKAAFAFYTAFFAVGEGADRCTRGRVRSPMQGLIASRLRREAGTLITEILVAMSIVVLAIMPLTLSFSDGQKTVRHLYQKSTAMEVIDGEMEILMAGEWRAFKEGSQPYPLPVVKNLPRGKAVLTIAGKHVRLEWVPDKTREGAVIVREALVK